MDGKFNLFTALTKRMDWLSQRQRVLSTNIANADTPNYIPRDLDESRFRRLLRGQDTGLAPRTTDSQHLRATPAKGGPARPERDESPWEASPSGNAVVLEEQLIKVARTQSDYQMITNLYRKHVELFRIALRGSN